MADPLVMFSNTAGRCLNGNRARCLKLKSTRNTAGRLRILLETLGRTTSSEYGDNAAVTLSEGKTASTSVFQWFGFADRRDILRDRNCFT